MSASQPSASSEMSIGVGTVDSVQPQAVDVTSVHGPPRTVFDVPLAAYPMQPWARAAQQLKHAPAPDAAAAAATRLRQWFNYNLTPHSWAAYAATQLDVRDALKQQTGS